MPRAIRLSRRRFPLAVALWEPQPEGAVREPEREALCHRDADPETNKGLPAGIGGEKALAVVLDHGRDEALLAHTGVAERFRLHRSSPLCLVVYS